MAINKEIRKKLESSNAVVVRPVSMDDVEAKILMLRNQAIIIDSDVAELYGVATKEVNQAVKNNLDKFPFGYLMELDKYEKAELVKNFDRFNSLKHSTVNPTAFTERGLYMLATILKGARAVQTTITIIDTFAAVKELTRTMHALQNTEDKQEQKSLLKRSGELIGDVIGSDLSTSETETELELNFAVLKVKHTVKRSKPTTNQQ